MCIAQRGGGNPIQVMVPPLSFKEGIMSEEQKKIKLNFKDEPPEGVLKRIRFLPDEKHGWRKHYKFQMKVLKMAEREGLNYEEY